MSQIRGTANYHLGPDQRMFGGSSHSQAVSDPSPLDAIREQTNKIEDILDTYADPIKPYVLISRPYFALETFVVIRRCWFRVKCGKQQVANLSATNPDTYQPLEGFSSSSLSSRMRSVSYRNGAISYCTSTITEKVGFLTVFSVSLGWTIAPWEEYPFSGY